MDRESSFTAQGRQTQARMLLDSTPPWKLAKVYDRVRVAGLSMSDLAYSRQIDTTAFYASGLFGHAVSPGALWWLLKTSADLPPEDPRRFDKTTPVAPAGPPELWVSEVWRAGLAEHLTHHNPAAPHFQNLLDGLVHEFYDATTPAARRRAVTVTGYPLRGAGVAPRVDCLRTGTYVLDWGRSPTDRPESPVEAADKVLGLLRTAYTELTGLATARIAREPRALMARPVVHAYRSNTPFATEFSLAAHVLLEPLEEKEGSDV